MGFLDKVRPATRRWKDIENLAFEDRIKLVFYLDDLFVLWESRQINLVDLRIQRNRLRFSIKPDILMSHPTEDNIFKFLEEEFPNVLRRQHLDYLFRI
jgi:hypothetical protein